MQSGSPGNDKAQSYSDIAVLSEVVALVALREREEAVRNKNGDDRQKHKSADSIERRDLFLDLIQFQFGRLLVEHVDVFLKQGSSLDCSSDVGVADDLVRNQNARNCGCVANCEAQGGLLSDPDCDQQLKNRIEQKKRVEHDNSTVLSALGATDYSDSSRR